MKRTQICPQCSEPVVQPRDSEDYCENCGWPDENRQPMTEEKTLTNTSVEDVKKNVSDVVIVGNDDARSMSELEYRMAWSSEDGFAVWESCDGTAIQFTGPDGEVVSQQRVRRRNPASNSRMVTL